MRWRRYQMGVDAIGIQLRSYKKMDVLLKIEIMNDNVSFGIVAAT